MRHHTIDDVAICSDDDPWDGRVKKEVVHILAGPTGVMHFELYEYECGSCGARFWREHEESGDL